jgi:uncharacterized protein
MIVDVHVHMAGVGDEEYDGEKCHLSREFKATLGFKLMLLLNGQSEENLTDEEIRKTMLGTVYASEDVDKVVLLAMDRVYDSGGHPLPDDDGLPEKTQFYTPNEYIAKLAAAHPDKVLFGASVHPDRPDAVEALEKVKDQGAVLVKWLPSSQGIDPMRARYRSFYRKLADLKLPLLCHAGAEHSIPVPIARGDDDSWKKDEWKYTMLNRADAVVPALEEGVTVIAAHCSLPIWNSDPDYTHEFIRLMYTAKENGWDLFADLSALALPRLICPKRYKSVKRVVQETGIHDRLLLGSDFPVMVGSVLPELSDGLDLTDIKDLLGTSNPLDRNIRALRSLGFPQEVFERTAKVLGLAA